MPRPSYPDAPRLDVVERLPESSPAFTVADPYRWLEDPDSPETKAWLAAQDALVDEARAGWPGRDRLRDRLGELLAVGVVGTPVWRGERRFFMRRTGAQEHAVLHVVDPDGTERVLLDPTAIDPSGATTLDAWQPSKEGDLLAYQLSAGGTEESVLRVLDVGSGDVVDGPVDRCRYSPVAWLPGGEAYYYVRRLPPGAVPEGEEQYHRRVRFHRLGTDHDDDPEVLGDGLDPRNYYGVSVSRDGRWLALSASTGTAPRNDVWLADVATSPHEAPDLRVVQQGVDAQTSLHVGRDGRLYVWTDRDAPRGRLCVTAPETPGVESWRDLVPEDDEAVLEGYAILDAGLDRPVLLAEWTRHAVSEVSRHDLETGEPLGTLDPPGVGSVGALSERPEGGHEVWFSYTDHTTPSSVYHYDARDGSVTLWAAPPGSPPDTGGIVARQVTVTSKDGTPVRMFVVARADASTPAPTILSGYGGFGISLTPAYAASILAWVEAGGVYAVPGLRGGGEEGEQWHRAGMGAHKQNTFDDFTAAAEWLISAGWTTPAHLGISGGSNGGLLVGAALTQRPDLYAAVVCSAPLLDMVRYERFGLGSTWNEEYGRADDPTELGWLTAYSPYHHVREGTGYPAVLFTVFDSDTRVDPMHARKMCAALQHATSSDRPVLLRREAEVGHGARALSRSVELSADTLAFLAAMLGLRL